MSQNINFANHLDLALSCHNIRPEVALGLVQMNGMMLQSLHQYTADKQIVMSAVSNNPVAIKYSSSCLRADKDVIMCAVGKNGLMLCFAEISLRGDVAIVSRAVAQTGMALIYASSACKHNEAICELAVSQCGQALRYAPTSVRSLARIVKIAVKNDGLALEHCCAPLCSNLEIASAAIKQNGLALEWVGAELMKNNDELVMSALMSAPMSIVFAPERYKKNNKLVAALCVLDPKVSTVMPSYSIRGYSLLSIATCHRVFAGGN